LKRIIPINQQDSSFLPDYCTKQTLILGCGNRLFGDDGFGPAVIDHLLSHYTVPDNVYVADVGTGVRKLLFTLCLGSERRRRIIIIDAVDKGRLPGELFEIQAQDLPKEKIDDFSLHQVPSSNMVQDLMEAGVDVRVMACQVSYIPVIVEPGLTEAVTRAVSLLCVQIANVYLSED
jgi:coenzyme F420 hydrogenase subunit delta